ncbi:MAG TPA: hypothetical protein VJN90_05645 [Candidatus Acidoferrales bacterium]|nr:hypothetical protein [Candidatus Acidoferrales bacterium]
MSVGSGAETAALTVVPDLSVPLVNANTTPSSSKSSQSKLLTTEQDKNMFEAQVKVSPGSTSSSTTKNVLVVGPVY